MDNRRDILDHFQGKENVTKITSETGAVSYLTPSRSFGDEAYALGACKLNTVENGKKHILFLFNSKDDEVGRYYLGKKLQGKTPEQIIEQRENLAFFESWNPDSKSWVPCVGMMANKSKHLNLSNSNSAEKYASSNIKQNYSYTEEDYRREIAEQEEKDLLEYGTKDEKEIEKIKKGKKENTKFYIIIVIILFIIPILLMGMIQKCTGSNYNPLEDNTPWEPRHTQIYNPVHNTVTEKSGISVSGNELYRVKPMIFVSSHQQIILYNGNQKIV